MGIQRSPVCEATDKQQAEKPNVEQSDLVFPGIADVRVAEDDGRQNRGWPKSRSPRKPVELIHVAKKRFFSFLRSRCHFAPVSGRLVLLIHKTF